MYDKAQAEGITLSGQAVVTQSYIVFNNYLNTILKTDTDYAIASDTDSVVGDSRVNVDGSDISIRDYYDSLPDEQEYKSGRFVKPGSGVSLTYTTANGVVQSPIKYAMKHTVKKTMYRITCNGESVIVTSDHAIKAIDENGVLVDVKPSELTHNHKLLNISSDTDSTGRYRDGGKCQKV
jgi:hypothetical protein